MMLPRLAPLAAIAFPLFFTPGASRTPAAETDRVYARFEIFGFAGFHVLTNHTTIQEAGDHLRDCSRKDLGSCILYPPNDLT